LLLGMHPLRSAVELGEADNPRIDGMIYTHRPSALSAGLAVKQMDRLDEMNAWRRKNVAGMIERLRGIPGIKPLTVPAHCEPAWPLCPWTFVAEEPDGVSRPQFVTALQAEGVNILDGYVGTPLHLRHTFRTKQTHFGRGYPWSAHPEGASIVY